MGVFEILFVRHGLSCANAVLHEINHPTSTRYRDPELSAYGIFMSRARKFDLLRIIQEIFGVNPYHVGSSPLIRAQQTAYYMLLENTGIPLNILPHIGERGAQDDITPLPAADQAPILGADITGRYARDERGSRDDLAHDPTDRDNPAAIQHRANLDSFLRWIQLLQNAADAPLGKFFMRNPGTPATDTSVRRAVLFTHSGFLHGYLGIATQNNDVVHVRIDTSAGGVVAISPLTRYALDPAMMRSLDGCARVPTAGGSKKKRNSKKSTRRIKKLRR